MRVFDPSTRTPLRMFKGGARHVLQGVLGVKCDAVGRAHEGGALRGVWQRQQVGGGGGKDCCCVCAAAAAFLPAHMYFRPFRRRRRLTPPSPSSHLLSGGDDGCVRLWDVATEQCVSTLQVRVEGRTRARDIVARDTVTGCARGLCSLLQQQRHLA